MKSEFDISNTAKLLFNFENHYFDDLSKLNFMGWNLWRIVKNQIYFDIINKVYVQDETIREKTERRKSIKLFNFFQTLKSIFHLFFIGIIDLRKKNRVLVITSYGNKKYNIGNEKLIDPIVDGLFSSGFNLNYRYVVYGKINSENQHELFVKHDLHLDTFYPITAFIGLFLKKLNGGNSKIDEIRKIWIKYFGSEKYLTNNLELKRSLVYFKIDYYMFKVIYFILKPKLVIFNDQYSLGRVAAAKKMGIVTIELQHGLMDEYYPQYQLNSKFNRISNEIAKTTYIGVFGKFHLNQLLSKGYFKKSEIRIIGKMDLTNLKPRASNFNRLLFITQGSILYKNTISDLEIIGKLLVKSNMKLIIKLHPSEDLESYSDLMEKFESFNFKNYTLVKSEYTINELLQEVDVVVGYYSTVLLEAVYSKIFTISIAFKGAKMGIFSVIGKDILLEKYIQVIQNVGDLTNIINSRSNEKFNYNSVGKYLFNTNVNANWDLFLRELKIK